MSCIAIASESKQINLQRGEGEKMLQLLFCNLLCHGNKSHDSHARLKSLGLFYFEDCLVGKDFPAAMVPSNSKCIGLKLHSDVATWLSGKDGSLHRFWFALTCFDLPEQEVNLQSFCPSFWLLFPFKVIIVISQFLQCLHDTVPQEDYKRDFSELPSLFDPTSRKCAHRAIELSRKLVDKLIMISGQKEVTKN